MFFLPFWDSSQIWVCIWAACILEDKLLNNDYLKNEITLKIKKPSKMIKNEDSLLMCRSDNPSLVNENARCDKSKNNLELGG